MIRSPQLVSNPHWVQDHTVGFPSDIERMDVDCPEGGIRADLPGQFLQDGQPFLMFCSASAVHTQDVWEGDRVWQRRQCSSRLNCLQSSRACSMLAPSSCSPAPTKGNSHIFGSRLWVRGWSAWMLCLLGTILEWHFENWFVRGVTMRYVLRLVTLVYFWCSLFIHPVNSQMNGHHSPMKITLTPVRYPQSCMTFLCLHLRHSTTKMSKFNCSFRGCLQLKLLRLPILLILWTASLQVVFDLNAGSVYTFKSLQKESKNLKPKIEMVVCLFNKSGQWLRATGWFTVKMRLDFVAILVKP